MRKGIKKNAEESKRQLADYPAKQTAEYLIGIDPGTHTGVALWSNKTNQIVSIATLPIYDAIKWVERTKEAASLSGSTVFVRIEDAAKRTWFGKSGPERYKGAGSIERDCAIWREVLTELQIPFEAVAPQSIKGTPDAETFNKITGLKGRTSVHARDAAWMVYGVKNRKQYETI